MLETKETWNWARLLLSRQMLFDNVIFFLLLVDCVFEPIVNSRSVLLTKAIIVGAWPHPVQKKEEYNCFKFSDKYQIPNIKYQISNTKKSTVEYTKKILIIIHAWKYFDTFDVELFCQVVAFSSFLNSLLIECKLTLSKQIGNFSIILNHL